MAATPNGLYGKKSDHRSILSTLNGVENAIGVNENRNDLQFAHIVMRPGQRAGAWRTRYVVSLDVRLWARSENARRLCRCNGFHGFRTQCAVFRIEWFGVGVRFGTLSFGSNAKRHESIGEKVDERKVPMGWKKDQFNQRPKKYIENPLLNPMCGLSW